MRAIRLSATVLLLALALVVAAACPLAIFTAQSVYATDGVSPGAAEAGNTAVAASAPGMPVYRFRGLKSGQYLWTADDAERASIIAHLSASWAPEGVAYRINVANPRNSCPLWRFRNVKSGYYLYTADPNERANIIINLSTRWRYEGEVYRVSTTSGDPVWRFRNIKGGYYLYTSDPVERENVKTKLFRSWVEEGTAYDIAGDTPPSTSISYANATYVGRFADLTSPVPCRCAVSAGSRVRLRFTGTSLIVMLWTPSRLHPIDVEYSVDGAPFARVQVTGNLIVASGLANTTHACEVWLAGSDVADARWTNHYGLAVTGFVVDAGETADPWPTGSKFKMLTIGDSIGEGDLALGVGSPVGGHPAIESGRTAPGNQLADLIGADNYQFALSGASVASGYSPGGLDDMSSMLPYAMSGVSASDPVYDLVYVEVGHNDGSADSAAFRAKYGAIIDWVRQGSPNAEIMCMKPIGSWAPARAADISGVAAQKGCTYVDTTTWMISAPNLGHPDLAGQTAMANNLQPVASSLLASGP